MNQVQQATYLRKAYAYVRRYTQVKVLFWYLVQGRAVRRGLPGQGVYTGLRNARTAAASSAGSPSPAATASP